MKKHAIRLIGAVFLLFSLSSNAGVTFVKFKNYLIPIKTADELEIVTQPVTNLLSRSADINLSVISGEPYITAWFEFAIIDQPIECSETAPFGAGVLQVNESLSRNEAGLRPGKTYHFRACAIDNTGARASGEALSFTTPEEVCDKPKVIVSTDYGDFTLAPSQDGSGDSNEPQDLVHFLAYSNLFDVKGFIAAVDQDDTGVGPLRAVIDNDYRYDLGRLNTFATNSGAPGYRDWNQLRNLVFQGAEQQLASMPSPGSVNSPGVNLIIQEARAASAACPVNVLVWGKITDVAAAVYHMDPLDRENLKVIAIGSSNRCTDRGGDNNAWTYLESVDSSFPPNNFIKMDQGSSTCNGTPQTDIFRGLHLTCGNQPMRERNLYDQESPRDIMNDLTDGVGISNNLRGLLAETRVYNSWQNCQNGQLYPSSPSDNFNTKDFSLRIADAMTTLYLLDQHLGFNGQLKAAVEANDRSFLSNANLRTIYQDFRARMSSIYN